jgi:hypothetical protein
VRNEHEILVEKPYSKIPLGRPVFRWYNIKVDRNGTGSKRVDVIHLFQDRNQWRSLMNMVMIFQPQYKARNLFTHLVTISFSGKKTLVHGIFYKYARISKAEFVPHFKV